MKNEPEHPSHGLALFCVVSNSHRQLFGSPLHAHYTSVRLTISAACIMGKEGDGDTEQYINGEEYIEVEFSAQQFGELLSRQNIMPGIPCTILRRNGESVEPYVPRRTNQHKINSDFKTQVRTLFADLKEKQHEVEQVLAKKAIGVGDKEKIRKVFNHFRLHIEENLPFAIEMFTEATHNTVAAARQEVAIAFRTALQMAGGASIKPKELIPPAEPPLLKESTSNEPRRNR